jgi:hypothetical protein
MSKILDLVQRVLLGLNMTRILLLALCVVVVLQVLGLPFTLLDTIAGLDDMGSITPEGFTLQASLLDPFRISPSDARIEFDQCRTSFHLARSIFHPPPSLC